MKAKIIKEQKNRMQNKRRVRCWIPVLCIMLFVTFCSSSYKLIVSMLNAKNERDAFRDLSSIVVRSTSSPEITGSQKVSISEENDLTTSIHNSSEYLYNPATCGDSNESVPLTQYVPIFEMNTDFFGWLSIEGTDIDYPVMYSPDRPEYYINRAFDGSYSGSGVPFLDGKCLPNGNYYLIYGHHMKNKAMFGSLPKYADESYYEDHPIIRFDTLYEQREYQVIAAFYSRIYAKNEAGVFRYYEYTDLTDEAVFEEYIEQVQAAAIYDTGYTATYGDELLTLSTCNYHTQDGRFVVVAKRSKYN